MVWQSWEDALLAAVKVHAVDSSSAALAWAQLNVDRLSLASRVLVSSVQLLHPCSQYSDLYLFLKPCAGTRS